MLFFSSITVIFLILVATSSLNNVYSQSDYNFLKYKDPERGFNIAYHESWILTDLELPNVNVMFMSPGETAYDEFGENVIVITEVFAWQMNLDEYVKIGIAQLNTPNFELIESTDILLSDNPAKKLLFMINMIKV